MTKKLLSAQLMAIFLLVPEIINCDVPATLTVQITDILSHNVTHCFEMLGCIATSKEWLSINRPFNLPPSSRDDIGTNFKLYTRENNMNGETLRVAENGDVSTRFYQANKDTKIIVHGFNSNVTNDWIVDMVPLFLKGWDLNVITTDWSDGALATYGRAVTNTRLVGLEIANLVNALIMHKGSTASKFHCIGYSLGAHICGYAGERIHRLERITGLDPAGPLFYKTPTFVRLDPSDARFVDVIHTDAEDLGYGSQDISGNIDFYPNGGKRQPGAQVPGIPLAVIPQEIAEAVDLMSSHGRAVELFMDSMKASPTFGGGPSERSHSANSCPFVGFKCDSYESFLQGNCTSCGEDGSECAVMGIDADTYPVRVESQPKKFFLKTNSLSPYNGGFTKINIAQLSHKAREGISCVIYYYLTTAYLQTELKLLLQKVTKLPLLLCHHLDRSFDKETPLSACHYALKLTLAEDSRGRDEVAGDFTATLLGDNGVVSDMKLTESGARKMKKGESYTFLGSSPVNTGHISSANIKWKWNPKLFSKETCLINCVKDIFISHTETTNLGFYPIDKFKKSSKCNNQSITEMKDDQLTPLDLSC